MAGTASSSTAPHAGVREIGIDTASLPIVDIIDMASQGKILRAERHDQVDIPAFIAAPSFNALKQRFSSDVVPVIAGLERAVSQMKEHVARHCAEANQAVQPSYEIQSDLFETDGRVGIHFVTDKSTSVVCMIVARPADVDVT